MGTPINYETVFFRRPLLTDDNIRFGSILFALFFFTLILHFFIFNWLKTIPVTQLQENNRREYVAFIAESVNIIKSLDQAVELPLSVTYSHDEIPAGESKKKTSLQGSQAGTSSINNITNFISKTNAMGIATIATAVESTPGYTDYIYMTDRQEKSLTLRKDVTVYRSHQKHIQIPLPEKIQFASQNGNRDLFETTATMEMNEIDIKYCFEKVARYDPKMSGDLLVSFSIHPNGHVIPTSVKVINSNIRDPRIIDCIRKQIQRWRNFKQIAFKEGNFTITRKYIF